MSSSAPSTPFLPPPGLPSGSGGFAAPPATANGTAPAATAPHSGPIEAVSDHPATVVGGSSSIRGGKPHFDARQIALLQLCFDETELTGGIFDQEEAEHGGEGTSTQSTVADCNTNNNASAFDAALFVREKASHVSLTTLAKDLEFYAKDVDSRVMTRIHEDVHESFIAVSGQLVGMQDQLGGIMTPLNDMRGRVQHASEGLAEREAVVESLCDDVQAHEMERVFNVKLLEILLTQETLNNSLADCNQLIAILKEQQQQLGGASNNNGGGCSEGRNIEALASVLQRSAIDAQRLATLRGQLVVPTAEMLLKAHPSSSTPSGSTGTTSAADGLLVQFQDEAEEAQSGAMEAIDSFFTSLDAALKIAYSFAFGCSISTVSGVNNTNPSSLVLEFLNIYKLLGEEERCCSVYSSKIVQPIVEEVLSWKAISECKQPPVENTVMKTEKLLETLKGRLEAEVFSFVPLLRNALLGGSSVGEASPHRIRTTTLAGSPSSTSAGGTPATPTRISIITEAVWPAVLDTIVKRMNYLFSAGITSTFHRNFHSAQNLVAAIEGQCKDLTELSVLRSSANMLLWNGKWNVDVYHNMLQTEMMQRLKKSSGLGAEQPLSVVVPASSSSSVNINGQPYFQASIDLCEVATWYFSSDRLLFPLVTKFVRDIVGTALSLYVSTLTVAVTKMVGGSSSSSHSASSGKLGGGRLGTTTAASVGKLSDTEKKGLQMACFVIKDFSFVQQRLVQDWIPLYKESLGGEEDPSVSHSAAQLEKYLTTVLKGKHTEAVLKLVSTTLVDSADAQLSKAKSIKGKFWATKESCPKVASDYVKDCLGALSDFKKQADEGSFFPNNSLPGSEEQQRDSSAISSLSLSSYVSQVAASCCEKLNGHLEKVMLESKKVADMASKKTTGGSGGDEGGQGAGHYSTPPSEATMRDSDKMAVQVYRDVEAFGDQLGGVGITKESFEPFKRVQLSVGSRGRWILGMMPTGTPIPSEVVVNVVGGAK